MILQREILKIAEMEGVPPDTIDKNWVLGHFLSELYNAEWAREYLVFKGGTCLKKCYFPDYRFSEDLDFTLTNADFRISNKLLQSVCNAITAKTGILFSKIEVEPLLWLDKKVGYKSHIRFWGANHKKSQQPPASDRWQTSIKVEIIFYELIVNNPEIRPLFSYYSDHQLFEDIAIPCYPISEVVAEKFRALLQRSYPAPRDYYDLWKLFQQKEHINWGKIVSTFIQKAKYKDVLFKHYDDFFEPEQIRKVKNAWKNSLGSHLKEDTLPDVEFVITELQGMCKMVKWS